MADVKASLPEYDWAPQMVLTVTVDDPGAVITSLRVFVSQQDSAGPPVELPPALAFTPTGSV